ncbi:hypothetical protein [Bacillus pumilus]|uniref:hypothetical protein n=1 Tax=Bacillus pumilus TaxID=1408 RepID=UPI001642C534|nr:hypothetical protein [Bacillus pumilus]
MRYVFLGSFITTSSSAFLCYLLSKGLIEAIVTLPFLGIGLLLIPYGCLKAGIE